MVKTKSNFGTFIYISTKILYSNPHADSNIIPDDFTVSWNKNAKDTSVFPAGNAIIAFPWWLMYVSMSPFGCKNVVRIEMSRYSHIYIPWVNRLIFSCQIFNICLDATDVSNWCFILETKVLWTNKTSALPHTMKPKFVEFSNVFKGWK